MSFTYLLSNNIGVVRLIIQDTNQATALLSDEEITTFLTIEGDVKLSAAQCLDAIASNEVLVTKKLKMLDLTTDGPAVSAELRKHAASLRAQVYRDLEAAVAGTDFDWAEEVLTVAGERERLINQALRGAL